MALAQVQHKARGATAYITLEPCAHQGRTPPCVDALIAADLKRVVIASEDPNPLVAGKGIRALQDAGIAVEVGVCAQQAKAINKGFFSRMQRNRPYVRAKIAMSVDGRVAMASGESQWITGSLARQHGHCWRARSGAIITGSGTVLADNCRLSVREFELLGLADLNLFRQPLRVVIDSQHRVPPDAAMMHEPGETVLERTRDGSKVDLTALIANLAKREINDVLIEAGPGLVGAFLAQNLIDELLLYIAPSLLGAHAQPLAYLPGLAQLSDKLTGEFGAIERLGSDIHIVFPLKRD
jgi:diaminohydroxyphosphoribosylaminopyrimidine deaminase/5-amino-6-(5-phosphoribosylamino)uracil reductase